MADVMGTVIVKKQKYQLVPGGIRLFLVKRSLALLQATYRSSITGTQNL